MLKILYVLLSFVISGSMFTMIVFWVLDGLPTKTLKFFSWFSLEFNSVWRFWIVAIVITSPLILALNVWVIAWYCFGYQWIGESKNAWPVQILVWAVGPIVFTLMAYFWRNELPTKGSIAAFFLCVAAVIVSKLWK